MRYLIFGSLVAGLALTCSAADQLIDVTPLALDGWTVTGSSCSALSSGSQLILPAGAQLSRKFSDSMLVVHLVSRPVFSQHGEDWPIIGLGSVALVFVRQEGQEHLVLVTDESNAIDLLRSFPESVAMVPDSAARQVTAEEVQHDERHHDHTDNGE